MDDILRYYEILGLKPGATEQQIKQAYRDLAKVWHPDRFPNDPRLQEKAQEKLKEINLAYDYLKSHRYTPPPEEDYYQEEEPVQEEKPEPEESRTTHTTAHKTDSFFAKIPKWLMIVIAIALIRGLSSIFNAPSKPPDIEPPAQTPEVTPKHSQEERLKETEDTSHLSERGLTDDSQIRHDSVRKKEIEFQIDDSTKNLPAYELINLGWGLFIGRGGKVDEKAAYGYTKYELDKALSALQENPSYNSKIVSLALNNIGVFHSCCGETSMRDWNLGHTYFEEAYKYKGSSYAPADCLWHYFLHELNLNEKEVTKLAEEVKYNHKVFKYLNKLGRLPQNRQEAISFLVDEAMLGDPEAALWTAYEFECDPQKLDFSATEWYKFSLNHSEYGSEIYKTAAERLQRLELLKEPR